MGHLSRSQVGSKNARSTLSKVVTLIFVDFYVSGMGEWSADTVIMHEKNIAKYSLVKKSNF